jgi:hypothetical protein
MGGGGIAVVVALHIEDLPPKAPVGVNAEEGLTQSNEDGKVENGIGSQLPELNPVEEKERAKKLVGRERKPVKQKSGKHNSKAFWRPWAGGRTWMKEVRFGR